MRTKPPTRENGHVDATQLPMAGAGMSRGQREAMEVAEAARDAVTRHSFAGDLFMGRFDPTALAPFPVQNAEDQAIGDALVADVSAFLRQHHDPEIADESRTIPAEVVAGLRDLGVFRMKVPQEYGGLGLSQVNYNRVVGAIASYCGSTAVLVSAHQSIGVPQPLKMFGTEEQKARFLKPLLDDEITSCYSMTEPQGGSAWAHECN